MIPQGAGSLIAFLVFVAPGAAFGLIWDKRRPGIRETPLREVNRLVLVSLAAWVLPALLLGIPRIHWPWWGQEIVNALVSDDGWRQQLGVLAVQGVALSALAIAIASMAAVLLTREKAADIHPGNPWNEVFRRVLPDDCLPYAWVTLLDGTKYGGVAVAAKTGDVPAQEREIVLGQPLRMKARGALSSQSPTPRI